MQGIDPWSRKIPHAMGQVSLCTTATEPLLHNEKPPQWEAQALKLERSPHSTQLEKAHGSNEDPVQPKK